MKTLWDEAKKPDYRNTYSAQETTNTLGTVTYKSSRRNNLIEDWGVLLGIALFASAILVCIILL